LDKELIINSTPSEVEVAILENKKLVELHKQKTSDNFSVGDIFLGQVKKTMPGLNAAFVDIGHEKDAFLHYTDLGPQLKSLLKFTKDSISGAHNTHRLDSFELQPDIFKNGKIDQVLEKRQPILIQILKEPISTKGPRLSCEITIPGRFLVLTPFTDVVAISKKIADREERSRLKTLIESIKPKKMGVIVRTAGEGKGVADLHTELRSLENKWKQIFSELKTSKPPLKLLSEIDKTSTILRDMLNGDITKVVINEDTLYKNIKSYLGKIAPKRIKIASHYKGSRHIFDAFPVNRQIKGSFGKTSTLRSGVYLVMETTEAMHVIDVNSGPKMIRKNQEDASIQVNLEAAEEIARQLRLRDFGGLIIIDFIDMRQNDNKVRLFKAMKQFMANDRAQHTILPLSKFGLMQITRQRVKPAVKINTDEVCAVCDGSGTAVPSILVVDQIENDLSFIIANQPNTKLTLEVHPYLHSYLKKGFPSLRMKWWRKHGKWLDIRINESFHLKQFKFFNAAKDEIRLG